MGVVGKEEAGTEAPILAVRFPPIWSHIAPLAAYVGAVLESRSRVDGAERVGIVVHELLENAVKYGDPVSEVKLELFTEGRNILVRVTNNAHPSRIAILERELRRTRQTPPHEAFARALERLQHLPEGSTMLGLARVALEATLTVKTTGGEVVVTASIDTSARATRNPVSGTHPSVTNPVDGSTPSLSGTGAREDEPAHSRTAGSSVKPAVAGKPTGGTRQR